jgi:hypothetical protein
MDSIAQTAPRDYDIINETATTVTLGFDSPYSP